MSALPAWHYDEFRHVGADFSDPEVADHYDDYHQSFRGDLSAEADHLLDELGIGPGHILVDMGCGTGNFAIQAAKRGTTVYAVDVSPAMLAVAERKALAAGVSTITYCHAGYLTYEHAGAPADFVTSTAALHHLPDFWKLIGLQRIAGMLKEGGLFYLMDVVYSFPPEQYADFLAQNVKWFTETVDESFGAEAAAHYREEFSTCDWIMEGLLTRAGFTLEQALYPNAMTARYFCRKGK